MRRGARRVECEHSIGRRGYGQWATRINQQASLAHLILQGTAACRRWAT